jgi:hypothetical protein
MNTMNMPGFTAEASLYKTNELYRAAIKGAYPNGAVYRAQFFTWPPRTEIDRPTSPYHDAMFWPLCKLQQCILFWHPVTGPVWGPCC